MDWRSSEVYFQISSKEKQNSFRICREVATERDLLNCHGTFYELPAGQGGPWLNTETKACIPSDLYLFFSFLWEHR